MISKLFEDTAAVCIDIGSYPVGGCVSRLVKRTGPVPTYVGILTETVNEYLHTALPDVTLFASELCGTVHSAIVVVILEEKPPEIAVGG